MEELFEIEESLPPWEAYKKEFSICVTKDAGENPYAWIKFGNQIGIGDTEEQAVDDLLLACGVDVPTFDEWRMKGGQDG